jgi:hypothetical protein
MLELLDAGTKLRAGALSPDDFWIAVGRRLDPPSLELDVTTAHHLYADLLAERYPHAHFVHIIRDVRSWANSMLDMGWLMRRARARLGMSADDWGPGAALYADTVITIDDSNACDNVLLPGLLRMWSEHMERMEAVLPTDRTITVRMSDLSTSWVRIAQAIGADPAELRTDHDRVRIAPLRYDRFLVDRAGALAAYNDTACAINERLFPDEHAQLLVDLEAATPAADWAAYCTATDEWVDEGLRTFGPAIAH